MTEGALTGEQARRIYDRLGRLYDLATYFEGGAKRLARRRLELRPGHLVLNAGAGSGRDHRSLREAVTPGGEAYALDLSGVMARLTHQRTGAPSVQANLLYPPFADNTFDRAFIAYVLDLIPAPQHAPILRRVGRLLRPEGRLAVLALTEGVDPLSRLVVGLWKGLYAVSPTLCAGCRPLELQSTFEACGFQQIRREVVVDFGVPSEIVTALAP